MNINLLIAAINRLEPGEVFKVPIGSLPASSRAGTVAVASGDRYRLSGSGSIDEKGDFTFPIAEIEIVSVTDDSVFARMCTASVPASPTE